MCSLGWKSSATSILIVGGIDLLYFLHVVPERQFDIIGGDAAETIISEDEDAERRAVRITMAHAAHALESHMRWSKHAAKSSPFSRRSV